ncbi:hypothetical protein [Sinorhizobium mexicanum]|uniref:hypothetical protein n=1 Tax=Sinorhizobium mexicanum TaxID=375549 RepID=UPI0015DF529B|nr:hypothetical protein [Sinorhizobium mexicanum]MBP1887688.1 hypothetical protein [Sinorhizobium mexicanum]
MNFGLAAASPIGVLIMFSFGRESIAFAVHPRNSRRKTATHFSWNCVVPTQFPAENRYALFLELLGSNAIPDGKPLRTFPGIAWFQRNSGRKTATHFSWNCVVPTQFPAENRYTLFLELLS